MNDVVNVQERTQSLGEEIANSVSHGVGLLVAIASIPLLLAAAMQRGGLLGASIFATTMVLLYLTSTLYHAWPHTRVKQVFRTLDHAAIYLLIAGTYTPFTLGVLRGVWGWTILGVVWTLAIAGVVHKALGGIRHRSLSTGLYLGMGWLGVILVKPLLQVMPGWGLFWLAAGGISYTVGVVFFACDRRLRYGHFVWHLFVLAGTACHFIAVLWYAV
jgi:hemolysin III